MTTRIEQTPPVRWGDARWRYRVGLVTIVLGAALTNLISTYSLWFLLVGPCVQLLGWLILPGALWRRLLVLLPCLVAALVLVAGPDFAGAFAVLLAGWLFARHRPGLSYLALIPVIVLSFVLKGALNEYGQNWVGLVSGTAACVACAWLAWALALWRRHLLTARRLRRARRDAAGPDSPNSPESPESPKSPDSPDLSDSPGNRGALAAAAEPVYSPGPAVPTGPAASAADAPGAAE